MNWIKNNWLMVLIGVVVLFALPKLINIVRNMMGAVESATDAVGNVVDDLAGKQIAADREDLVKQLSDQVNNTKIEGQLSKSLTSISGMATRLYEEMQGFASWVGALPTPNWGLSEDIYDELKTYTKNDLLQLYKTFGVKENKSFKLFSNGKGDLIYWFKAELKDPIFFGFDYLTEMKKIWQKTGKW